MNPRTFTLHRTEQEAGPEEFVWVIGCAGYESRSIHAFSKMHRRSDMATVFVFEQQQVLEFQSNRRLFATWGFTEVPIPSDRNEVEELIARLTQSAFEAASVRGSKSVRIIVDISSMTRQMISLIAFYAAAETISKDVVCQYCYSPAQFGELPNVDGPILSDGPVCDKLAGWSRAVNPPCGLIIGIGYEQDLALGVIEDLEAGEIWAFRPRNSDPLYDAAINEHNRGLEQRVRATNWVRYSVHDPYALFVSLNQLVMAVRDDYRAILVPFGPKIFALCSTLVALRNYPQVGLWRVSAGPNLTPVDRKPTGDVVSLFVAYSSMADGGE